MACSGAGRSLLGQTFFNDSFPLIGVAAGKVAWLLFYNCVTECDEIFTMESCFDKNEITWHYTTCKLISNQTFPIDAESKLNEKNVQKM